jgi:Uma2 family endonuclease
MARPPGRCRVHAIVTRAVQPRLMLPEFVESYAPLPGKYEQWGGVPVLMADDTACYALIGVNIVSALRDKLRATGCALFNSDTMLRVGADNARLPDAAIYCDPRDLADPSALAFERPCVVLEILSPSTARMDRGARLITR